MSAPVRARAAVGLGDWGHHALHKSPAGCLRVLLHSWARAAQHQGTGVAHCQQVRQAWSCTIGHRLLQRNWIMEQISPMSIAPDNKFVSFGERLRSERLRIGLQQLELAEACDVARKTLSVWEKGEQTPNAAILSRMALAGVDVLYVVTGHRQGESESTLAPEEKALLSAWRNSSDKGRALLGAAAEVLKPE